MTIYDRIESLRKSKGLSQGKLEKQLGFSNGSISKWKNSTPKVERLQKLADFFGVSVEYLMTGKEEDKKEKDNSVIDIKDELERMRDLLKNRTRHPIYYDGEKLDDESLDAILAQYEMSLIFLEQKKK